MRKALKELKNDEAVAPLVEAITPAVERTANRVVDAVRSLVETVSHGVDALAEQRQGAATAVRDAVTANPMRAIGVTLAAGLVLGLFMRKR